MRKILLIDPAFEIAEAAIDEFCRHKQLEFKIVDSARDALDFMTSNEIEKFSLIVLISKLKELTVSEFIDTAKLTLKQNLPPIIINSTQFSSQGFELPKGQNMISRPLGNENLTDVISEILNFRGQ
jgi:DNA-binding response OmpR family regulator